VSYWDYEPVRPPVIYYSKDESNTFGMSVTRASYSTWNGIDSELKTALHENDLVILRTRDVRPFDQLDGFVVIPAGAIIYWVGEIDPDFDAGNSDYQLINNLIGKSRQDFSKVLQDSFSEYTNHYDFNDALQGITAADAYLKWAMTKADSGELTGLLTFKEVPIGVVSAVQQGSVVEVEIAGIAPGAQGQGHYAHLIGNLWRIVDQPNLSKLVGATQIENLNAQSAWAKIGLKPQFEVHTTHIMRKK
jgi:hypothetical protein